jgi:hypothetical protein
MYRLLERLQLLDERLRRARSRRVPDPIEIMRLRELRLSLRGHLSRLARSPAAAV